MSAGGESGDGPKADLSSSRHSNENKSVKPPTADSPTSDEERIQHCVREFVKKYPKRSRLDLATGDRVRLRREYANVESVEWEEDLRLSQSQREKLPFELDSPTGTTDGEVSPYTWASAVQTLLERHAEVTKTTINLEKRYLNNTEEYHVDAQTRWSKSYQKKYAAQLDAWLRELTGGERPSGGETAPSFDTPRIALITLSASSKPDGVRVGPVDHLEALRSSWESVYHQMRNTLRSLGFDSDEWQYDRRAEPHTGQRGNLAINECYGHEHIVLVIDGEVSESDLRPIVEKHVDANDWAGEEAHGPSSIEIREPDELEDVAAYVAGYCSIEPTDLLDRSPTYQAWAAAATAANYRTVSRSEAARIAAKADACRQRAESEKSDQIRSHGEEVRKDGEQIVCACCGTSHDIDQSQTLTEYRLSSPDLGPSVADGGQELRTDEARQENLRKRWPTAARAATLGESTSRTKVRSRLKLVAHAYEDLTDVELAAKYDAFEHVDVVREVRSEVSTDPSRAVGFGVDKPHWMLPTWELSSVTVDGEEYNASSGGGMEFVETTNYRERFAGIVTDDAWYRCDCGVKLYGEQMADHLGRVHGIEQRKVARTCVHRES
ncbi:hypothetical protein [Halobellus rubicundus]|uniref:C2H2-type domain-containing protein n=1 Tax=Halobellus rubicundus TaxID=2996466 RepID=A0ABD5MM62_9EURY